MIRKNFTASLIQFDCPDDKSEAIGIIEQRVGEAAASGAELVLVAEVPYTPYTTVSDFHPVAEEIPGTYTETLSSLARTHGLYLCSGIVEARGEEVYNTAVLLSPEGEIIHTHRKTNLADSDKEVGFARGSGAGIVETGLGRIGILICLDTASQELRSAQAALDPDIVLVPSYGLAKYEYDQPRRINCMVDECIDEWRIRMQTLAKSCAAYVLRADHCGVEPPQVRVGHSIAVSPGGYVIAEATMRPAILTVRLDASSPCQRAW